MNDFIKELIDSGAVLVLTHAAQQGPPGDWPVERAQLWPGEPATKLGYFLAGAGDEFGFHTLEFYNASPMADSSYGGLGFFNAGGSLIAQLAPADPWERVLPSTDPARRQWLEELFAARIPNS